MKLILFLFVATIANAKSEIKWDLSSGGVGPIKSDLKVTEKNLKKLFPGYEITKGTITTEGEAVQDKYTISKGAKSYVEISNMGIDSPKMNVVTILDPEITGPKGLHVGSSFSDLLKIDPKVSCIRQEEERSQQLVCQTEKFKKISFVIEVDPSEEATERFKKVGGPMKDHGRKIQQLIWWPS